MKQEDYLAFPNTNNFDALLDSFCHDEQNKYYYHNLTPCGWDIEKYLIATSKGLVKREKSKLAIQTTLKGKLTFEENVRDTIRSSGYKFNQYLDKAGYYLIEFHSFEACPEFFLINYHSGEKLRFSGYPFFSPDETQVLVADYDYGLGWCTNSFSWWKLVNNNWVESVNYKPNNWGIEDAKWINETTVVARIGYITNRKNPGEEKFFVRMEMVGNNNTKK
ncbi:MAG: hypothetical protein KDC24_03760 [Saprospiraceae bacterium]|nr:hypothetical protein [Saprospiraceae bacterium]